MWWATAATSYSSAIPSTVITSARIWKLPSVCWVPLAVLLLGIHEASILFVLVMGSFFAIAIALRDGLRQVPPIYKRVALMLGARRWMLYRYVMLPAALPAAGAGTIDAPRRISTIRGRGRLPCALGPQSSATIGFEAKLWLTADKLRNNMDAAEYKHVVLGLIFLKYISDTFEEHRAKLLAGQGDYAGANAEDPDEPSGARQTAEGSPAGVKAGGRNQSHPLRQ